MSVHESMALLAYGPVPGIELIPYGLGLVAWVGLAFLAIALSPITALVRRLRGRVKPAAPQALNEPPVEGKRVGP